MEQPITPELRQNIRTAAIWFSRLCAGEQSEQIQRELESWLAESEQHRQAWQQVSNLQARLQQVPGQIAGQVLNGTDQARRRFMKGLLGLALVAPAGLLAYRHQPWQGSQEELLTHRGERRQLSLPGGGQLLLDSHSAIELDFSPGQRLVRLLRGQILIDTRGTQTQPLQVTTGQGLIQAQESRFSLRKHRGRSRLMLHQGTLELAHAKGSVSDLSPGWQLEFNRQQAGTPAPSGPLADAWTNGNLVALDMPLGQLLDELAYYHTGLLGYDEGIANLKISGSFPLDDTEQALSVLTAAFPIRRQRLLPYWVRLVPA